MDEHEHLHKHDAFEHNHEHTHGGETHTHEHCHDEECHTHGHDHANGDCNHTHGEHGHGHMHNHDGGEHCHNHEGHTHSHGENCGCGCGGHKQDGKSRSSALLKYMLEHNEHHTEELQDMSAELKNQGLPEAAELILSAVDAFNKGNKLLSEALQKVQ